MTIPGGVPWVVHRVAVSGHYRDSLVDILDRWTLTELVDAHAVIDALDAARRRDEGG